MKDVKIKDWIPKIEKSISNFLKSQKRKRIERLIFRKVRKAAKHEMKYIEFSIVKNLDNEQYNLLQNKLKSQGFLVHKEEYQTLGTFGFVTIIKFLIRW